MRALSLGSWVVVAAVGCGGGSSDAAQGSTTAVAAVARAACPSAAEIRVTDRLCLDVVGTQWRIECDAPGGHHDFRVVLLAGGRLRSSDHVTASAATDEWFVDGVRLRMFLGNRFVEYRGQFNNGSLFVGEASNMRGDRWAFRATREPGAPACAANELTLPGDGRCFSIGGSTWSVVAAGRGRMITLLANGTLADDSGTIDGGRWTQEGATVQLALDGQTATATLSADHLDAFEARSSSGAVFSATRVVSHPPAAR